MNVDFLSLLISILSAAVRMSVPLCFASIGGAICEKAGIIALGLEGYITIGAFFGMLGSLVSGNAYAGVLVAAIAGGLFSLVYAFVSIHLKAEQTVSGLGMNTIAPGLVAILMMSLFGNKGKSSFVNALPVFDFPILGRIPVIGTILNGNNILFYLMLVVTFISYIYVYKTPWGLRLRATGTNPEVIEALGLSTKRIQYFAVIVSGVLAGIGGSYLSLGQLNFYSDSMSAGRGFIAIAVFVFARWNPAKCLLVSLLFGLAEAVQMRLQVFSFPSQIVQMLPYVCTMVILAVMGLKKKKGVMVTD